MLKFSCLIPFLMTTKFPFLVYMEIDSSHEFHVYMEIELMGSMKLPTIITILSDELPMFDWI